MKKSDIFKSNIFGDGADFDHIGVAVRSIRDVSADLKIFPEESQKVSVAFIDMNGVKVELVEPLYEDTPITANLKKGERLVHICFRVPDIDVAVANGRKNGFHCIAKPVPSKTFNGKKIIWLFSMTYGLVELLEG